MNVPLDQSSIPGRPTDNKEKGSDSDGVLYNLIVMAIRINQGPIVKLMASDSRGSLFTQRSNDSDEIPQTQFHQQRQHQQAQQKQKNEASQKRLSVPDGRHHRKLQPVPQAAPAPFKKPSPEQTQPHSSTILPHILHPEHKSGSFALDSAQRYSLFNQGRSKGDIREEELPKPPLRQSPMESAGGARRSIESRHKNAGSSQGSRWLKSQSLNVPREKTFKHLIRSYHKHDSVMVETLTRFWETFEAAEHSLSSSEYRLSLLENLEADKLKMESFLERSIKLENLDCERPEAEWNQEQYMKFYGQYKRVYSEEADQEVHRPYTLKKYKNCIFFGRMEGGRKDEGILHYFSGKCFEGRFRDDQKLFGLQIDHQELYLGEFRKGLRHGHGILKTSEALVAGTFTYGDFTTAQRPKEESSSTGLLSVPPQASTVASRKGFEITHSALRVFEGEKLVVKNGEGDIFVGRAGAEGEKQGEGLELFVNGDMYVGRYESNSPEGYGEYYWENGSYYRGQFLSGMRHGRGAWAMLNGDSYEGEYMNDKKNGKGTYLWKNGSKYKGNFENDYRHGYGEMHWQDGRVYKGKWLNGIEKNTVITLEPTKPTKPPRSNSRGQSNPRGRQSSFRSTLQKEPPRQRKLPLDQLKSLYNPSHH